MTTVARRSALILCTNNSCRSQMAEGFLRAYAGEQFDVFSAGLHPAAEVHPLAVQVMLERNIDIRAQRPKSVGEFLGQVSANFLIIVCREEEPGCPRIFPGMLQRLRWPFDDPAAVQGEIDVRLDAFRTVRDEIDAQIKTWLATSP
jgi:arsenate reductase